MIVGSLSLNCEIGVQGLSEGCQLVSCSVSSLLLVCGFVNWVEVCVVWV